MVNATHARWSWHATTTHSPSSGTISGWRTCRSPPAVRPSVLFAGLFSALMKAWFLIFLLVVKFVGNKLNLFAFESARSVAYRVAEYRGNPPVPTGRRCCRCCAIKNTTCLLCCSPLPPPPVPICLPRCCHRCCSWKTGYCLACCP